MNTSSDIWVAFAKTFSMLFLVLALLILAFYLIKKLSTAKGVKGGRNLIKILCVHHLSPKEKIVLLDVLGDTFLIGVTPNHISKLSSFGRKVDLPDSGNEGSSNFSDYLTQKLGHSFKQKGSTGLRKGDR